VGIPQDRTVVAYLGLLAPYQGTDLLLEAASIIQRVRRDVHYFIMGFPGVDTYRMKAIERGLADHVTFTGKVNYEDAPRYLRLGDVAVAPKVSETEGCGKLLNYMACALPTVAFDTPVSREYLGSTASMLPRAMHRHWRPPFSNWSSRRNTVGRWAAGCARASWSGSPGTIPARACSTSMTW